MDNQDVIITMNSISDNIEVEVENTNSDSLSLRLNIDPINEYELVEDMEYEE